MKLHHDSKLLSDTFRAASQHLDIKVEFLEKDYWITLVLSRLAISGYAEASVFKGGTSLSKGYSLIDRFSTDVDIAIITNRGNTGNEIKNIIRAIEKEITSDLKELETEGITSKGSRFRKSVFEYVPTERRNQDNTLIVEINSFANPFPYQQLTIQSMVFDFLMQTGNDALIDRYNLQPFRVNVLNKEQTLLEKMVSLMRVSFSEDLVERISGKIRHFYDLYYLVQDLECAEFIASDSFKARFDEILDHDREIFEEPVGWRSKSISASPLMVDFPGIWQQLKEKYTTELSALAYRPIPRESDVAKCFGNLIKRIE